MHGTAPRPASRWDGLAIAALALGLWLALGQNLIHGFDAYVYLRRVAAGDLHHELHALYLPTAWAWSRGLGWLGVPQYEAMRSLSAVAAAIGVFACHRAAVRLGFARERAAMLACGAASVPALCHAATVVEIDAVAFGCQAVAWMPFAALLRRGAWSSAVATGVATGVAASYHASGHLFAASLGGLLLLWHWPARRGRTVVAAGVIAVVHAAVSVAITRVVGADEHDTMASNLFGLAFRAELLPSVFVHEFLLPYAPFGVLAFAAIVRRELRGATVAYAVCLLVYLYVTTCILGHFRDEARFGPQGRSVERGAFLLGLVVPMVTLTLAALPRRVAWAVVAVGACAGLVQQRLHDWPPDPPGYAAGWAELDAARPSHVIFADAQEWAWVARRYPGVPSTFVGALHRQAEIAVEHGGRPLPADHVTIWFAAEIDAHERGGRRLLLTDGALAALRASGHQGVAAAAATLGEFFTMERVAAGSFRGWWLRRR